MIIVANEILRKYISFENGKWIHDPNMPETLKEEFYKFVQNYKEVKKCGAEK